MQNDPELRLALCTRLMQEATHTSEAAIRSSLSRMYYAVFHLGVLVTGKTDHGNVAKAIQERYPALSDDYEEIRYLRSLADYNPDFVLEVFGTEEGMREQFGSLMDKALQLYISLKREVQE